MWCFPIGTVWTQEILPLVLNGGDLTPIQTIPNWDRVPWLEEKRLAVVVDQLPSPRAMVTHFPYHLMPPSFHKSKAKVNLWLLRDFFPPLMLILRCFLTFSDLCVGCAVGDLHHQEPQGRPGFLLLLPSDGWISWGSRNVRWVHGKILGRQRWEVMTKPVAAFISVRWRPCCLQCCLENGPITWRAGDTQILETE